MLGNRNRIHLGGLHNHNIQPRGSLKTSETGGFLMVVFSLYLDPHIQINLDLNLTSHSNWDKERQYKMNMI